MNAEQIAARERALEGVRSVQRTERSDGRIGTAKRPGLYPDLPMGQAAQRPDPTQTAATDLARIVQQNEAIIGLLDRLVVVAEGVTGTGKRGLGQMKVNV